jgi:hypothetical protein
MPTKFAFYTVSSGVGMSLLMLIIILLDLVDYPKRGIDIGADPPQLVC